MKIPPYLLLFMALMIPCQGAKDAKRCDKQGLEKLVQIHKKRCALKDKSQLCQQLFRDLNDYLAAFASGNDAFCARISHKYGLVIDPEYYKKRLF